MGLSRDWSWPTPKASVATTIWCFSSATVWQLYPCIVPFEVVILVLSLSVILLCTSFLRLPTPNFFGLFSKNSSILAAFLISVSTVFSSRCFSPGSLLESLDKCRSIIFCAEVFNLSDFFLRSAWVPLHSLEASAGSLQPSIAKCSLPTKPLLQQIMSTLWKTVFISSE